MPQSTPSACMLLIEWPLEKRVWLPNWRTVCRCARALLRSFTCIRQRTSTIASNAIWSDGSWQDAQLQLQLPVACARARISTVSLDKVASGLKAARDAVEGMIVRDWRTELVNSEWVGRLLVADSADHRIQLAENSGFGTFEWKWEIADVAWLRLSITQNSWIQTEKHRCLVLRATSGCADEIQRNCAHAVIDVCKFISVTLPADGLS